MKTILTLCVSFMLATLGIAQTTPVITSTTSTTSSTTTPVAAPEELDMLTSIAGLKSYALNQVTRGSVYIWGQTILASVGEVRSFHAYGDADEILGKLMMDPANKFKFQIRGPGPLTVFGELANNDGDTMFSSYGETTPISVPSGCVIYPVLRIYMNQTIAVRVPAAEYAWIDYTNPAGEKWTQQLNVFNEKIYFPAQYAGRGTLIIGRRFPSGNNPGYELEIAYNLNDGKRIITPTTQGNVMYAGIENHEYANDKFMNSTGPLLHNVYMGAPSKSQWGFVSPPTGAIRLENTPVGTSRVYKVSVAFQCEPSDLGTIEAPIYDLATVDSQGVVTEYLATITTTRTTNTNGAVTTIVEATWTIKNNGGSKWCWRFESSGFNKQLPPSPPSTPGGAG